ncbi:RNA polymerase sigma factor, partial [Parabacteroides sp. OttesenSCG-928-N08]|nr:RNA polymerase sigma factor [Parabacteroides sp. OttesenSCG-928-N08]
QFQTRLVNMQDYLMNLAMILTTNKEDAYDLLQDTTLKALDNRDKFVDNSNFKGWVVTIMRNLFINNYHRTVRTYTIIDGSADLYNLDSTSHSGFDSPDRTCDIKDISNAIDSLSEEYRSAFSMYVSGYPYNEIAEMMNIPLGTVKSRIFYARQELQKRLKDYR